ncbi:hypothetical protein NQZ68_007671 [Dissostichus eleginoides]|nr:hypothetical protein NQZ68_007671 [Dissostichus eleginoides]
MILRAGRVCRRRESGVLHQAGVFISASAEGDRGKSLLLLDLSLEEGAGLWLFTQKDGRTSPESWFSVKLAASGPGEASQFPILLIVGLLCGVLLIILLLLFLYLYRKSKDSCCIRSQRTNQGPATDHMINQDEIQNMPQYSTLLHGDRCASNEPEESLYSNVAADQ